MKERKEDTDEIVVLEEGIEPDDILGPDWLCCSAQLIPFR